MESSNLGNEVLNELMNVDQPTEVRQLFIGNLPFRIRWQDIKDLFRKAGHVVRADVALNHENRSKGHGTVLFSTVGEAQKAIEMFNGYKWQGRVLEVRGDRSFFDNEIQEKSSKTILKRTTTEDNNNKIDFENLATNRQDKGIREEQTINQGQKVEEKADSSHSLNDKFRDKNTLLSPSSSLQTKTEGPVVSDNCKQLFVGNIPFHCETPELKELFQTCGRILKVDIVLNLEGRSRGFGTVLFSSHEDAKRAIEKFDGYEFHSRLLRVHFDKFAASHQRLREQEAETYGQRQLQDPYSVQLLKETYLPQQTIPYNQLINGLLKPPTASIQHGDMPYAQTVSPSYAQTISSPYTQQYSHLGYSSNLNTNYYSQMGYNPYSMDAVHTSSALSNNMLDSNFGSNPQQEYPQKSMPYNITREMYSGNDTFLNTGSQQNYYQPWMNSAKPLHQQQQQQNYQVQQQYQQYPLQTLYDDRSGSERASNPSSPLRTPLFK